MNATADGHELTLTTRAAEETRRVGEAIGRLLRPNDVVLLFGDLGAGKTTLVQGLAAGLGAHEPVTSPTFTLIHEYHVDDQLLVHVDPYRLEGPDDLVGVGLLDYLGQGAILAVEWAERLGDLAPPEAARVSIEQTRGDERRITIRWQDERSTTLAKSLETLR